jgi:hypothetical protein
MESASMRISPLRIAWPRTRARLGRRAIVGGLLLVLATVAAATAAGPATAAPLSAASPVQRVQPVQQVQDVQAQQANRAAVTSAPPPVKVTWSILPATAAGPDRSRNLFDYGTVKPGSTIVDRVEIANDSAQSAAFSIYGTDATGTSASDALLLLPPQKKPTDIGAWVHFPGNAPQLSTIIPARKAIIETFSVVVPTQATPGDHTGGLAAAVSITHQNASGVGVTENYRIAVPLELRVTGPLHAGLQVQSISTGFSDPLNPFADGSATISYSVKNTGNVRLTGTQVVAVSALFGQATVKPPQLPTILPGDSIRVTAHVPGLFPAGPMTAKISVTPGWPPRTQPLKTNALLAAGNASLFAMPWSLLGLILLLVAIGVGIWFFLRWRRRMHRAELAAVAARTRRDTERRLLGVAAANGHGGSAESSAGEAPAESSGASEASSSAAEATAPGGTQDAGGAATESATE